MDRNQYIKTLEAACRVLGTERLRQVAKVAHQEMEHQARASAMQAQVWPDPDDIPTAGDYPDGIAQLGAEPEARVCCPSDVTDRWTQDTW